VSSKTINGNRAPRGQSRWARLFPGKPRVLEDARAFAYAALSQMSLQQQIRLLGYEDGQPDVTAAADQSVR
jgi:hypothetical protein